MDITFILKIRLLVKQDHAMSKIVLEDYQWNYGTLDDDVWMEEPVPERHLCIHENSQHDPVPLPLPIQFESATPHSRRCLAVHSSQQHL